MALAAAAAFQPQQYTAYVQIGEQTYADFKNPESDTSFCGHLVSYTKSANGAFRCLQLFDRVLKLASHALEYFGSAWSDYFSAVSSKLATAWAMMNFARLPQVSQDAWNVFQGSCKESSRSALEGVQKVMDATAAWGYAAAVFIPQVLPAADVVDLLSSTSSLAIAAQDAAKAKDHLDCLNENTPINAGLRQRFSLTMKEALARVAAKACSVATGACACLVFALGGAPLLLPLPVLCLKLTSTVSAIASHFYEKTSEFALVKFNKVHTPSLLIEGNPVY